MQETTTNIYGFINSEYYKYIIPKASSKILQEIAGQWPLGLRRDQGELQRELVLASLGGSMVSAASPNCFFQYLSVM